MRALPAFLRTPRQNGTFGLACFLSGISFAYTSWWPQSTSRSRNAREFYTILAGQSDSLSDVDFRLLGWLAFSVDLLLGAAVLTEAVEVDIVFRRIDQLGARPEHRATASSSHSWGSRSGAAGTDGRGGGWRRINRTGRRGRDAPVRWHSATGCTTSGCLALPAEQGPVKVVGKAQSRQPRRGRHRKAWGVSPRLCGPPTVRSPEGAAADRARTARKMRDPGDR